MNATTRAALDATIVRLLGAHYDEFRKLAALAAEQPASRPYAEQRMAALLRVFTPSRRAELRAALAAGGDIEAGKRERAKRLKVAR